MVKPEELIAAGACLSIKEKLKNESLADSVSARLYRHPALGARPVVRLSADNLAEGDDLTMEFLGFAKPDVTGPVAKRRRAALGFPGWAIINDPKHARYALELVKEFKKAVRRSKSKPGFGYDEFTEISKRLGKSVAHFLPSFWEQAGREFIALDNATYGSRCFGKAREAERVHALKVDEALRQDAFLEFALAGAVSIKAITEYGKELLSTHDPKAAWKFFRELSVRRTLGGMPPWTSMVKDLQPLMKAAGLDQDSELQSILVEIIDSPAITRASMGFWDGASKAVSQLVKKNPHVAGVLLNMIPQTSSWRNDDIWPWLKHLDSWGILANAWQDQVAEAAAPTGGPAAWLSRLIRSLDQPRQKVYDIVEAMAPRLRKDKEPANLFLKHRWRQDSYADVDLIDMALELKIPFTDPPSAFSVDLKQWAATADPTPELRNRPRDPVHLAADTRFTKAMHDALEQVAGDSVFETVATGKVALRDARRNWLKNLVAGLSDGGLPRVENSLMRLENKTRKAIFQEFPDVLEQLRIADIRPAVLRSIQGGLMDEYGWPALERVFESFVTANQAAPKFFGHFPFVILTDRLKAVVIKGEQIVHEAELKLPKGHELKSLLYIDGDLLVWSGVNYQCHCYWNSDPQLGDPEYLYTSPEFSGVCLEVPGGGNFVGEKVVHRGDKGISQLRATDLVVSDGVHWWVKSHDYDATAQSHSFSLQEVDPSTGKKGRRSLPSFFEDFAQNGSQLDLLHCTLLPVGESFPKSPLGTRSGLVGFRVRRNANGTIRLEGVDGRLLEALTSQSFGCLLDQPATSAHLPVTSVKEYNRAIGFDLWDPTGSYEVGEVKGGGDSYSRGQVTGVSALFLHAFQIRDAAASKKLRACTAETVRVLTDAEQQDFENFNTATPDTNALAKSAATAPPKARLRDEQVDWPLLDAAIRKWLGNAVHPRLLVGLRGVIIRAGNKIRQLAKLVESRSEAPAEQKPALDIAAADVAAAPFLGNLQAGYRMGFRSLPHISFMECVEQATRFLKGEIPRTLFPSEWLMHLRKLTEGISKSLWLAHCTDPKGQQWMAFAELWSKLPYHTLPGSFRIFTTDRTDETLFAAEREAVKKEVEESGAGQTYVQWSVPYVGQSSRFLIETGYQGYDVLEYSPTGKFESIPQLTERKGSELIIPPGSWSADQIEWFVGLAKSQAFNYPPVDLLKALAADVKASVAEVALVWFGLPGIDAYSVNFMPTHLREACKLKTKECTSAKEALKEMKPNVLLSLTRAVVAGDPADLWEKPPTKVADRIRAAWQGEKTDRLQLSNEWVEKLSGILPRYGFDKRQFLQALNSPLSHPYFSNQSVWKFGQGRYSVELVCQDDRHKFDASILKAAGDCIAMLACGLPVGDPGRIKVVELYQATIKALANPGLLLSAGSRHEMDNQSEAKLIELMETIVGQRKSQDKFDIADDGQLIVLRDANRLQIAFRPAKAAKPAQLERLSNQLNALLSAGNQGYVQNSEAFQYLQVFRSSDFQALVDRILNTPVPAGSYETNPLLSAPDLVKQVAKKFKLSDDAAAYYLQLIALPDPTDKQVMLWNGWTAATIKAAGGELVKQNLVLEASRTRAGRKFFLPGGWEDLKAPHLPIETWKMPLFRLVRDAYQRATPPLERIVPLEPVHQLFAKAWTRIVEGDVPKYEEVK